MGWGDSGHSAWAVYRAYSMMDGPHSDVNKCHSYRARFICNVIMEKFLGEELFQVYK